MEKEIPFLGSVYNFPIPPTKKAEDYLNSYKGWVYSSVTAISNELASIKLHLYKRRLVNGVNEPQEVLQHEALSLIGNPNNHYTSNNLLELTQTYLELLGEGFWVFLRDNFGRATELYALRPDWIKIVPSKKNVVDSYIYGPPHIVDKEKVRFPVEDIIPFKYLNPKDAYRGKGAVQAGAMAIDIDDYSQNWNRTFFFNSALPGLVFTTDKNLNKVNIDRFMTEWASKFQGSSQAHKVAFLGGGLKPEPITTNPKDMDFLELRKLTRDEILGVFRVPRTVLGITDDVNRANAEATKATFMERVILPRMVKFVSYLNEFYLREWEDEGLYFDFENPVPENIDEKLRIYESGLTHKWLTINEVRERENLEPVEWGDEPVKPDMPNFGNPSNDNDEDEKKLNFKPKLRLYGVTPPPVSLRILRNQKEKEIIKHELKDLILKTIRESTTKDKELIATMEKKKKEDFWLKMIKKTDTHESIWKEQLIKLFSEQERDVKNNVANIKYYLRSKRKGKEAQLIINQEEEIKKWRSIFSPLLKKLVVERGNEILEQVGDKGKLNLNTRRASNYLQKTGLEFIKDVNATTAERLKKSLAEGLENGEGVDELSKRVEGIFESATESRAKTISRTEVLKSTNWATLESYKQSDVVKGKEWLTALDERTCPECEALDGKTERLNDDFEGGIDYPPLHPSCRCTIIPVLLEKQIEPDNTKEIIYNNVVNSILEKQVDVLFNAIKLGEREEQIEKKTEEEKQKIDKYANEIVERAKVEADNIKQQAIIEKEKEVKEIKKLKDKAIKVLYNK